MSIPIQAVLLSLEKNAETVMPNNGHKNKWLADDKIRVQWSSLAPCSMDQRFIPQPSR